MRNIALTLKYLGTAYHGWQVQKTVTTAFHVTASRMRSTRTCRRILS